MFSRTSAKSQFPALQVRDVLLVEDNPGDVRLVQEMLRESFSTIELRVARTVAEALELVQAHEPDCLLLDFSLPDGHGLEVVQRFSAVAPKLPIVVLSGLADETVALQAVQEGAQDYLIKGEVTGALITRSVRYAVERKRAELELAWLAMHDHLTMLPNRALFTDRLQHALRRTERDTGAVALLFVDLDGFKRVNDMHGHEVGDELLVEVAKRLSEAVRGADTVARMGGDEFTALCEAVVDAEEAVAVAERAISALERPFPLSGGAQASISASVGITLAGPLERATDVMRRADAAMYRAKGRGPGQWELDRGTEVPAQ